MEKFIIEDQLEQIRLRKLEKEQKQKQKAQSELPQFKVNLSKDRNKRNGTVNRKSIIAAILMFLFGGISILIGSLIHINYWGFGHEDRGIPLLIIGSLLFLPGSYTTWVAYCSWKKIPGYSFNQIPPWDE